MASPLHAEPECIPCALRQVLSAAKRVSDDAWFQTNVIKRVMAAMSKMDTRRTPAEISFEALKAAGRVLGVRDPYAEEKRAENAKLMELLPDLRKMVGESSEPVALAARLAVAGNIIDLGILSPVDVRVEIDRALSEPLAVDDTPALKEAVRAAKSVLYILDNAGEIVLDRLLLEQMKRKEITCVVRASPIINDATMDDAIAVGIDKMATVIDAGTPMLGLVLNLATSELRDLFNSADLVISKGQANFETLCDADREIYFLLRAKCPVVARALGVPLGGAVVARREPDRETETRVANGGASV